MPKGKQIVIVCHNDGYRAFVEGERSTSGFGWDVKEALGDLVASHPDLIGVSIRLPHTPPAEQEPEVPFVPSRLAA